MTISVTLQYFTWQMKATSSCLAFLTLRLFRAASAPIIVCTVVIKFFISRILWGEIKSVVVLLSTLLDKNLTCAFKRKNSFALSKSCMKTEQYVLLTVKSSLYPQLNNEELDHKAKERLTSLRIRCDFLLKCLSSGWQTVSLNYAEKKPFNSAQVA